MPTAAKMTKTARIVTTFHRRLDMLHLWIRGLDDRRLPLIPADGCPRDVDPDLIRDLNLNALLAESRDLPVDPARRNDFVVDFQIVEKLLHLLLLALAGEQDDEIENSEDEDERHRLQQRVAALGVQAHGEHGSRGEHHHEM